MPRSTVFDFKSCLRTRKVISRNGTLVLLYPFQGAILAVEMAGKNNSTSCSKSNVEKKQQQNLEVVEGLLKVFISFFFITRSTRVNRNTALNCPADVYHIACVFRFLLGGKYGRQRRRGSGRNEHNFSLTNTAC